MQQPKNEIDLLHVVASLREEDVRESLGKIESISQIKHSIKSHADELFSSLNVKSILFSIDSISNTFDIECRDILNVDTLSLDDTQKTIEGIYKKIYKIEDYRNVIQSNYTYIQRLDSVLKVIKNSFTSVIYTLDMRILEIYAGKELKTKSGQSELIESILYTLESYITVLDSYKSMMWRQQERCTGIVNILLKQESSIRLLHKDIANIQNIERKLSE